MSGAAKNKVFISYAWEADPHQERVVSLANALRDNGFEGGSASLSPACHPRAFPIGCFGRFDGPTSFCVCVRRSMARE